MKRAALVFALSLVTPACGLFSTAHPAVATAGVPSPDRDRAPHSAPVGGERVASEQASSPAAAPADSRKIGDFYVHRFSGSYAKSPLTLTEEVVAQEDGLWVIDYTFEQPSTTTKVRVRLDPKTDSVVRVAKLDATGNETKLSPKAYEKLMNRTSFSADTNDGMVASEHRTCLVGPSELDCETKSYDVWVGEKQATLSVSHSDSVPNRDVSGDITAKDGTLIYRSELVEMGTAGSPRHGVASR